jgi:hypothetical protein
VLFNWLVYNTVIEFSSTIYDKVADGVTAGWTAFRDIANILIIGIFSFIAISIILGLKTFGEKKLIANVLIIAVLINFSLLFTKIIIDASNFTATEIYKAAAFETPGGQVQKASCIGTDPTCGYANRGIAGAFVGLMGLQGVSDTYEAMVKLADEQDSGWIAVVHGAFISLLFLGAALVLLYGCFLLVSRVVLIIFLMVTASLAFASYLVPKWQSSQYGWSAWWGSLLRSAVFAPILIFLLWATLNIAQSMKATTGTLGGLLANPTKTSDITSIFSYLIVLGLLFLSFKLSSVFSSKIAGFNIASMAALLPATLASRMGGFALRQTAGWAGYAYQKSQTGQAKDKRNQAGDLRYQANQLELQGKKAEAEAKRSEAARKESAASRSLTRASYGSAFADSKFNVMNTAAAKAAMGAVGVTGFAAGASSKDAKSYAGRVKEDAEAAEKRLRGIGVSGDDEKKIGDKVKEDRRNAREIKLTQKEGAEQIKMAIAQAAESQKQLVQKQHDDSVVEKQRKEQARDEEVSRSPNEEVAVRARHAADIQAEEERIQQARNKLQKLNDGEHPLAVTIDGVKHEYTEKGIEKAVKDLSKAVETFDAETKIVTRQKIAATKESAAETAEKSGRNYYRFSRTPAQREYIAKEVRSKFKAHTGNASLKQTLEEIAGEAEGGGTPVIETPAAPTGGADGSH